MNLIIDVGNSWVKMAVYNGSQILHHKSMQQEDLKGEVQKVIRAYPKISHSILAAVTPVANEIIDILKKNSETHVLHSASRFPFKNKYGTPDTLGLDRIALVAAATEAYPNTNVLIIDAGSCITYDFLNAKGEYLGGAISPGIAMRYKALNTFTANLPELEKTDKAELVGNSTDTSVHSGIINGVINEVDGMIERYRSEYRKVTVILTGGDGQFLSKRLKNTIFAHSNFLLEGLNYLLELNKH
ncbi:MAG: type III pantothenate kinase [Bacteroidia bacterium]|nr:type III pantothenate kinase [Bacteroidia bacterium]